MFFRVDFEPYMSPERCQQRRAQTFASLRLLEFSVYSTRGVPCEFILADASEVLKAAHNLVPPTVLS